MSNITASELEQMNVSMVFLQQGNEFLLQYRDPKTENGAAGLIGAFGGEWDEDDQRSAMRAAQREISEEVGVGESVESYDKLELKEYELFYLGLVHAISDRNGRQRFINAHVFETFLDKKLPIMALRGQLEKRTLSGLYKSRILGELTPATAEAQERFYQ